MKKLLTLCILILMGLGTWSKAQGGTWMRLEQKSIGLSYEIPSNWFVKGVLSPQKCGCEGGALNTSSDLKLNMLIFSSREQDFDQLQKQTIWGYHWLSPANALPRPLFQGKNLGFELEVSTWQEDAQLQVFCYRARSEEYYYLIYFWASPDLLEKSQADIEHILWSFSPISGS